MEKGLCSFQWLLRRPRQGIQNYGETTTMNKTGILRKQKQQQKWEHMNRTT